MAFLYRREKVVLINFIILFFPGDAEVQIHLAALRARFASTASVTGLPRDKLLIKNRRFGYLSKILRR